MYNAFFRFFGLRENPFNVNPDPGYLFLNQRTQAVLDDMASAIQARKGLIVLTGEVGTGKTSLINRLKEWLRERQTPTAFIFNPRLEVNELFDLMLAEFNISTDVRLTGSPLARLNQWLVKRHQAGANTVLILDEAQGLPGHVLEEICMLLNHELSNEKLLQIVMSGQPELEEKLKRPDLRQLRQRISLRCRTLPLTFEEAHGYIQKRLRIAGGSGNVFAPQAIDAAYLYSRGIPRVMNLLCEHAMIRAYLEKTQPVPVSLMDDVAAEMQFDEVKPSSRRLPLEVTLGMPPLESFKESGSVSCIMALDGQETEVTADCISQKVPIEFPTGFVGTREKGSAESAQPHLLSHREAVPVLVRDFGPELVADGAAKVFRSSERNANKKTTDRRSFLHLSGIRRLVPRPLNPTGDSLTAIRSTWSWILGVWVKICTLAPSPILQEGLDSALRWLQRPLPTLRVHRRVHD